MPNGSGHTITCRLRKENKMFNFDEVVDTAVKASKGPLTYVEDKTIRGNLETLVDSYAKFAKTVYKTNVELAKQVSENVSKFDYAKAFSVAK